MLRITQIGFEEKVQVPIAIHVCQGWEKKMVSRRISEKIKIIFLAGSKKGFPKTLNGIGKVITLAKSQDRK
jgi:hypothetical protein